MGLAIVVLVGMLHDAPDAPLVANDLARSRLVYLRALLARMTRVCVRCRERKPLREFWRPVNPAKRYGAMCHTCDPIRVRLTKRCRVCRRRKYLRDFSQHSCTRDGYDYRCKACISEDNRARRPKAGGICVDCQQPSHFRRCEACRLKHQAQAEALIAAPVESVKLCGLPSWQGRCAEALLYGVDRQGYTTMWCSRHGERLMPTSGVRHYDQQHEWADALEVSA